MDEKEHCKECGTIYGEKCECESNINIGICVKCTCCYDADIHDECPECGCTTIYL
jgi:hypothetical protein